MLGSKTFSLSSLLALSLVISACQPMAINLQPPTELAPTNPISEPDPIVIVDTTTDIKADILANLEPKNFRKCIAKTTGGLTRYYLYTAIFMAAPLWFFEEITEYWDEECTNKVNQSSHYLQYDVVEIKRVDANNNYNMKISSFYQGNENPGHVEGMPYNDMMAFLADGSSFTYYTTGQVVDLPINIATDYNLVTYLKGNTTIPLPHYVYVAPPPDLLAYLENKTSGFDRFTLCETVVRSGVTKYFYHSLSAGYNRGGYYINFNSVEAVDAACSDTTLNGATLSQYVQLPSASTTDPDYLEYVLAGAGPQISDEATAHLAGEAYTPTMQFLSGTNGTFVSRNHDIPVTMSLDWRSITLPLGTRNITLSLPPLQMSK